MSHENFHLLALAEVTHGIQYTEQDTFQICIHENDQSNSSCDIYSLDVDADETDFDSNVDIDIDIDIDNVESTDSMTADNAVGDKRKVQRLAKSSIGSI